MTCAFDLPDFFHIYSNIFAIYASGHDLMARRSLLVHKTFLNKIDLTEV